MALPGHLYLSLAAPEHHNRPAADVLFRSAAAVFGPRVIGVVLTGGDGDGTAGLRAVKKAGGIAVVQEPDDASDPGMPLSAIRDDHPDHCVALAEIAPLLTRLVDA